MPFIPKSTGIPTVDKVFKEVFAILNRFQGGEVASSSGEPVYWADIINKPTTFPPESHTQDISTINDLQNVLDNKEPFIVLGTGNKYLFRDKTWKEIDWDEIINKPSSFVPSTHGHPWSGIINKPSTFPPSAHSHLWSEITDKPSTFTPSSHVHVIADITSLQTTLDGKQPIHANLTSISNLSTTPSGRFLVTNGSAIVARPLQNSDLPAIAITDTFVVSSQAAMLALSAAERGDIAVRSDLNKSFILKGDDYSKLEDWQELLTPTDAVLSVDGRTGVVSLSDKYQPLDTDLTTIAGLTHSNRHVMVSNGSSWTRRALEEADLPSLSISKITGLQSVLDGKSNTGHSHAWSEITSKPSTFTPAAHGLVSSTHTVSGLTTGHVLKALSGSTYGFAQVDWAEITGKPSTFAPSAHNHDSVYAKLSLGTIRSSGGFATSLETDRIVFAPGIYSYRFMYTAENRPGTMSYGSVLTWGDGIQGAGQLAVGWATGEDNILMFRSLRDTTNPWWNWKQIYHTGYKPTPDDIGAEPAITGTGNKVLSIQADGTGVKTGSIYDNGNVALIGKTTASPGFGCKLEVEGNTLVNGTLIVNVIPAATTEVGVFLTHENNTIKTRTAAQVLDDIGAAPISHSHVGVYEPAITGTANKVLSIQAGGSGVKTGSIYDNGNVVHFEKAFIGNSLSTGIRHYHDVYLYSNPNSSETGILKIVMPQGWTNSFQRITIKGYNYVGGQGAWECIIGGHNYNDVNDANDQWVNYSAEIRGSAPFSIVRLGYDGSKCVILLGTTETVWRYAKVAISDMLVGGSIYNWETGWSASIISSETGLTKIVTPTVNSGVGADWNALINKPSTFTPSAHSHAWNDITGKPTGTTNYITMFTNGATGAIGNSQLSQSANEVTASKGFTANDYLQSMGPLYTRSHTYLLNKTGDVWLNLITRNVSGSEAVADLSNIGSIDGVGPITLSDGVGGYFQLYNNSGQGRAMLKTNNNMFFTVESPTLPAVDAITIDRDAGSLGDGIPIVDINAVTLMNEKVYIQSDVNVSHNSLVCLSGAVRYNYISHIGSVPTIDTDNYPGIYLIPSDPRNYTLTSEVPEQHIFVGNLSTHVQQVEGYRIEPRQFRDFLKTSNGWIASGASISGKTHNVSHGTGNISVSNVSTVHINYTPTSTYTLTNGYVGQRVTVVVLSGSAQHWIQGATKAHKIVAGEFRDFIYTTAGWVASAADY